MTDAPRELHYPRRAAIDGYGSKGFRFAGLSHRGSILILPSGMWAWSPAAPNEIDAASIGRVIEERAEIDFFLIGVGKEPTSLPPATQAALKDAGVRFDTLSTAAATSTYNILLGEDRRVAAALIAVD